MQCLDLKQFWLNNFQAAYLSSVAESQNNETQKRKVLSLEKQNCNDFQGALFLYPNVVWKESIPIKAYQLIGSCRYCNSCN